MSEFCQISVLVAVKFPGKSSSPVKPTVPSASPAVKATAVSLAKPALAKKAESSSDSDSSSEEETPKAAGVGDVFTSYPGTKSWRVFFTFFIVKPVALVKPSVPAAAPAVKSATPSPSKQAPAKKRDSSSEESDSEEDKPKSAGLWSCWVLFFILPFFIRGKCRYFWGHGWMVDVFFSENSGEAGRGTEEEGGNVQWQWVGRWGTEIRQTDSRYPLIYLLNLLVLRLKRLNFGRVFCRKKGFCPVWWAIADWLVGRLIDWLVGWFSSEINLSCEADTACCCVARGQVHGISVIQTGACEENGKFFGQRLWRRRKAPKRWYVEHFCRFRRFYRTWHGYEWKLLTKAVFFSQLNHKFPRSHLWRPRRRPTRPVTVTANRRMTSSRRPSSSPVSLSFVFNLIFKTERVLFSIWKTTFVQTALPHPLAAAVKAPGVPVGKKLPMKKPDSSSGSSDSEEDKKVPAAKPSPGLFLKLILIWWEVFYGQNPVEESFQFFVWKFWKKFGNFFWKNFASVRFLPFVFSGKPAISAKPVLLPSPAAKKAPLKKADSSSESSDEEPAKPTGQFLFFLLFFV